MNGFEEKKWFVYLGDHHEGPFSLADIQSKVAQGVVSRGTHVWAQGMSGWKVMTEVQAFDTVFSAPVGAPTGPKLTGGLELTGTSTMVVLDDVKPAAAFARSTLEEAKASATSQAAATAASALGITNEAASSLSPAAASASKAASSRKTPVLKLAIAGVTDEPERKGLSRALAAVIFLALIGGGAVAYMGGYLDGAMRVPVIHAGAQAISDAAQPALLSISGKVPALGKWISPIPSLEDVSQDEYAELKAAASSRPDDGAKAAVALSSSDPVTPVFYVTSNLPEGTRIDLYIEGVPDTLLNQTSFAQKTTVTISKRIGKSEAVRSPGGKPLARGEYHVTAVPSAGDPDASQVILPKDAKVLANKTYFLGGKKDTIYATRLKEFHDKLKAKATSELGELKQFAMTLESQLNGSIDRFDKVRKLKVGNAKRTAQAQQTAWTQFHGDWSKLTQQLDESFQKWTPESIKTDFFYGKLYEMTRQTGQVVDKVHGLQQSYFAPAANPSTLDPQLQEATAQAQKSVAELKDKLEKAEKAPTSPNGMPQKEEL